MKITTFVSKLQQDRRSSVESVTSIQRDGPETFIVTDPDGGAATVKTKCVGCVAMSKNHSVDEAEEKFDKVSVILWIYGLRQY